MPLSKARRFDAAGQSLSGGTPGNDQTTCDRCQGDDATGDGDNDGLCTDRDCNDDDATNACAIVADDFETGDTLQWSSTIS